jgi:hypothetical protein
MHTVNNSTKTNKEKNQNRKVTGLRLFTFKREFLMLSIDLQTTLATDAHLADGQLLEEQLKVVKLRMFRV